jgi:DNA (cytosine-5)-methyltransferase 1
MKPIVEKYARGPRPVRWAIGDLRTRSGRRSFDRPGRTTAKNQKRIDWLFDHDEHDLPDRLRPDCHRYEEHSYRSVYGRMYWDEPAQTITSGFGCMGQGRFVHPMERRTLTPHEAARLQFIPDFFRFDDELPRTALADMIGNAVPVKLTYVFALELLR